MIDEEEAGALPPGKVLFLCTGSQGEPRAALSRIARGEHRHVSLKQGDTVIFSSRVIPGNEKAILSIKNGLIDQGVTVIEDSDALVHVSGHPRRNELRRMYEWLKPKIAVPVHGEAAHLVAHAELAKAAGVADVPRVRDGDMVRLSPGKAEVVDQVPFGRVYKDGKLIGGDEAVGLKERRKLSFAGHVAVNVVLDDGYEMAGDPDLAAMGLPKEDATGEDFEELLVDAAVGAIDSIPRQRRRDLDLVSDAVRRAVRAAANEAWGKKPIVTVFVTR
jgi:ribonuclease J